MHKNQKDPERQKRTRKNLTIISAILTITFLMFMGVSAAAFGVMFNDDPNHTYEEVVNRLLPEPETQQ